MSQLINDNIDFMPSEMSVQAGACSVLQVHRDGTIVIVKVHAIHDNRFDEACSVRELTYSCWRCRERMVLWERRDSGMVTYYTQKVSKRRFKSLSLSEIFEMAMMHKTSPSVAREMQLLARKCSESVRVQEAQVLLHRHTVRVQFSYKKCTMGKKKLPEFKLPKAVNICYTGCIQGNMRRSPVDDGAARKNTKGPCGSEMHIDTSMGVLQIFSNNGGYRKITCKAFEKKREVEFVVEYVCNTVRCVQPPVVLRCLCCKRLRVLATTGQLFVCVLTAAVHAFVLCSWAWEN